MPDRSKQTTEQRGIATNRFLSLAVEGSRPARGRIDYPIVEVNQVFGPEITRIFEQSSSIR